MKNSIILLSGLIMILFSCSSEIQIVNYIDLNSPLTLTINTENKQTGYTNSERKTIYPKSTKFNMFINWCNNNSDNWESTPASYISKVSVSQNNFVILSYHDGVVISFIDKNGIGKQYRKTLSNGEMDFLTDDNISDSISYQ